MFITLKPSAVVNGEVLIDFPVIEINGDTINYNGVEYDLSVIPEGGQVEAEYPAVGIIKRDQGVINIDLVYEYNSAKAEKIQSSKLSDYQFNVESGVVPCPIKWLSEVEDVQPE